MQTLSEGEEEPVNVKPHSKVFDYEEDFEEFGMNMDKIQREIYTKEELDSIYLTTTNQIKMMNKLKIKEFEQNDLSQSLKQIKADLKNEKDMTEEDAIDIFGSLSEDTRKVKKLANKSHREQPKNKYSILRISKSTQAVDYKVALNNSIRIISDAIKKNKLEQDISAYKWEEDGKNIDPNEINVFNLNPEIEIENALSTTENSKFNLYKMNFEKGIKAIAFTNCIYYDNQNKTLPIGQDLSTKLLVDITKIDLNLKNKTSFKVVEFEDEKDDFSKVNIKTVTVFEFDSEVKQQEEN